MKRAFLFLLLAILCASTLSAQSHQELFSYLPEVEGWQIAPDVELFDQANLEYMLSMEYKRGGDNIVIQAYRHATPEDAFGMYASERSPYMEFCDVGGEGQADSLRLFFFAGPFYVKMMSGNGSPDVSQTMLSIAKVLANRIQPDATYPELFSRFPMEGRVPYTEAYIASNYIGHQFLNSAYTLYYDWNDRIIQLFVIDGKTKDGAEAILVDYFNFADQPPFFGEGTLSIDDRNNGVVPVIWKGRYIIGAYDETGYEFPDTIYKLLEGVKL